MAFFTVCILTVLVFFILAAQLFSPCILYYTLQLAIIFTYTLHSSIATIFGTNVAEKAGNQNVLYFPTSTNYCFCTT